MGLRRLSNPSLPHLDKRPIAEVISDLQVKTATLNDLDSQIADKIVEIQNRLRELPGACQGPVGVDIGSGTRLGWSSRKYKPYRFVVIDDQGSNSLLNESRDFRASMFSEGHMQKLVQKIIDRCSVSQSRSTSAPSVR